ncbi:MAG: LysE family transporter [Gammaproteobacteria bacterium]|nr:LysE family transporter [Gammaproteobacteria bacterium]MDH3467458.1 LysE family transporter [Gammaproteobacteria bacterium]
MDELRAFAFGITIAIAIGPIAILILQNGLNHGLRPATRSAFGAAGADLAYGVVAFSVGAAIAAALLLHHRSINLGASAILIVLGTWHASKAARGVFRPNATATDSVRSAHPYGFIATFALTTINPLTILVFLGFAGQMKFERNWVDAIYFPLFIFAGSLLVQLGLAIGGTLLGRSLTTSHWIARLNVASGIGIAGFGIHGVINVW